MAEWRHGERGWDKACGAPSDVEGFVNCGCTTPTPDPASPCAVCGESIARDCHWGELEDADTHLHAPILCTCGHPITKEET